MPLKCMGNFFKSSYYDFKLCDYRFSENCRTGFFKTSYAQSEWKFSKASAKPNTPFIRDHFFKLSYTLMYSAVEAVHEWSSPII
jgi:hypothetical protein